MTHPLWSFPIQRPVATLMITAGVAIFGLLSFGQLPLALMPALSWPTLTARTVYEGAAPEEIEEDITRPLEEVLRTVEGVRAISSTSSPDRSDIRLQFHWDTDMNLASQRVRERIDLLPLPDDVQRPLLLRYDPDLDPILRISLYGPAPDTELRALAEDFAQELEKIEGVAAAKARGGQEQIVRVDLDQDRLAQLGLSPAQVQQRINAENINLAGGQLEDGGVRYLVRTLNELQSLRELEALPISSRDGQLTRLGAIARVTLDARDREVITRYQGQPSVEVQIFKEADANLVEVADRVRRRALGDPNPPPGAPPADALSAALPSGVQVAVLGDQSAFVRGAIDEVTQSALLGGLLAILLLYLFLRSPSSTLIIGLAIPLSVVCTFAPMRLLGINLNVMSLGGLALGTGMLVDNSVVVLESIFRCRQEGDDPPQSALRGTREVGGAVIASTLTTIAVFLPIAFIEGVAGQLFGDLAMTVVSSLLASLAVALFVVPALASRQLQAAPDAPPPPLPQRLRAAWDRWRALSSLKDARDDLRALRDAHRQRSLAWLPLHMIAAAYVVTRGALFFALELALVKLLGGALALLAGALRGLFGALVWLLLQALRPPVYAVQKGFGALAYAYPRLLAAALRGRALTLLGATALTALSAWLFLGLGMELIPLLHQGQLQVELRRPIGTSLADTAAEVEALERGLGALPDLEHHSSVTGAELAEADQDQGEHTATLFLQLAPTRDMAARERDTLAAARDLLGERAGLDFELTRPALWELEPPLQVELRGYNLTALADASAQVRDAMTTMPELTDLRAGARRGFPEIQLRFDHARLASYGLDAREVAEVVRQKVQGVQTGHLRREERRLDILLRVQREDIADLAMLRELVIGVVDDQGVARATAATAPGTPIPLRAVADATLAQGPARIHRLEGQRAALIQADTRGLDLSTTAARLDQKLATLTLPPGVTARVGGQIDEIARARRSLLFALLLAVFLVYLVMASQFESLLAPLIIIFTVPLAIIGVTAALWLTHTPISVVVLMGLIMLTGIVVNNAIVLIDYALQLQTRGLNRNEAILEACAARLRPILITTLTTVLGLLPMALGLGEGAELRKPLAITVIAGLGASTALTLVVIPVVFSLATPSARPSQAGHLPHIRGGGRRPL